MCQSKQHKAVFDQLKDRWIYKIIRISLHKCSNDPKQEKKKKHYDESIIQDTYIVTLHYSTYYTAHKLWWSVRLFVGVELCVFAPDHTQ